VKMGLGIERGGRGGSKFDTTLEWTRPMPSFFIFYFFGCSHPLTITILSPILHVHLLSFVGIFLGKFLPWKKIHAGIF